MRPNKIIVNGVPLMDLTPSTISPNTVLSGYIGFGADGEEFVGEVSLTDFEFNTTEGWNSQRDLVGKLNAIYVYTDHQTDEDGRPIAGLKVGDGTSYLIDSPFIDTLYANHINDTTIHVTQAEREFWNSKVRCFMSADDNEQIVFTTL